MSLLDAMFEASSVFFFHFVNERAAHVKIDRFACRCRPGP